MLEAMAPLALRATGGWALSASAQFLRNIPEEGVGIPPAPVVGFTNFLSVYIRHLNHPNPLLRRSMRHGLLTDLWRLHPSQPCLTSELGLRCAAHPADHDLFVTLCHQCDISIHVPLAEHLPDHAPHVMALSSPGLESRTPMRGCLQVTAVRKMRAREDGPEYPLAPPGLAVATR